MDFFKTNDLPDINMIADLFRDGEKTVDIVGFFGPLLMLLLSIFQLWNQKPYLYAYIIGFVINKYINKFLKNAIKQPRPSNGKSLINESYSHDDFYGMPSYHAQSGFYSIIYSFCVKPYDIITGIKLLVGLSTLYQRWSYRRHSIEQLAVGTFIGCIFGYLIYYLTKRTFV
jgi:hypothetical protein